MEMNILKLYMYQKESKRQVTEMFVGINYFFEYPTNEILHEVFCLHTAYCIESSVVKVRHFVCLFTRS